MDPSASPDSRRGGSRILSPALIATIVAIGAAGAIGYWAGRAGAATTATPTATSAEAGFARDMQAHHIQGVEMAMVVRDRTTDANVRQLAYDIATTQGHQAGQLYGWLASWGLRQMGSQPPMTWMGHGHGMNALMPGMASPAQMATLAAASGVDAERQFLTLMIAHHRGAIEMAEAILDQTQHPAVTAFARGVLASQQSEIDLMTKMLEERTARR